MSESFVVSGLSMDQFSHLVGLSDAALTEHGAVRVTAAPEGRYPCRVTLEYAEAGETLLLVNYEHQAAPTPYRSNYAIYVREVARETRRTRGELPPVLRGKPIALRAYDAAGMLHDAALCLDDDVVETAERLLADPAAAYLHAHNAAAGCYAARIDRA